MSWKTSKTPKRRTTLIRIRFQDLGGKIYTGNFYWSDREDTWLESCEGPDGLALYPDHGWKVLGWKEMPKRKSRKKK